MTPPRRAACVTPQGEVLAAWQCQFRCTLGLGTSRRFFCPPRLASLYVV